MPKATLSDVIQHLRNVCEVQRSRDLTDNDLLQRFLAEREGAAFAVLVQRHGPMVLGLCRRILRDAHSAEDAFQATFMVLVRRAASLRCTGSLGNWLYAVAQRIATKARAKNIERQRREKQVQEMAGAEPIDELTRNEIRSVLDEEIARLPQKYRAGIVLCHLEGKSHEQAARELGWAKASLTSRLGRGRELLRQNLVRRGFTFSVAAVATMLAENAKAAPVGAMLTLSTVKAVTSVAAGEALGVAGLSAGAIALTEEAMKATFWWKAKALLLVLVLAFGAAGAGVAGYRGFVEKLTPSRPGATLVPSVQAPTAREQEKEAENLYRAMEKKILAAKSLKAVFEIEANNLGGGQKGSGYCLLAESDRARLKFAFENPGGTDETMCIVSDGKHISVRKLADGNEMTGPLNTTPKLNANAAMVLVRCGGFMAFASFVDNVAQDKKTDFNQRFKASSFRLMAKGKIGKKEAQLIEYTIALDFLGKEGEKAKVKLWIDIETLLPLQRRLALGIKDGKEEASMMETYTEFVLNPALDAKLFEIPPAKEPDIGKKIEVTTEAKKAPALADVYGDPLPEGATTRLGTVQFRAGFATHVMGFLPGGNVLTSKSYLWSKKDGAICAVDFWDAATGRRLRHLTAQTGKFTSVAFSTLALSPDGKMLLTSLPSLVDVATGLDLRRLNGFGCEFNTIAFSPDGRMVAAAVFTSRFTDAETKKVLVWDVASGEVLCRLGSQTQAVRSLAFSPDSKTLASACDDKKFRLWDIAAAKELWQVGEDEKSVNALGFSPDGAVLASAGSEGVVRLRDAKSGKLLRSLKEDDGRLKVFAFSPDGKLLAAGGDSGTIHVWEPETGNKLSSWPAHASAISSLAFSLDAKVVASGGSWDHALRQWDSATGKPIVAVAGHTGGVDRLLFGPGGKTLISLARDARIMEWDLATGKDVGRLFPGQLALPNAGLTRAVSPDGKSVAVASNALLGGKADPVIRLLDSATGKEIRALKANVEVVSALSFSPDGKLLASSFNDGVRVWDVAKGDQLHKLPGKASALAFSPDGKLLALGSDEKIVLWDVAAGKELRSWPSQLIYFDPLGGLVFSPDGKFIAAADGATYCVWATATGKEVLRFGEPNLAKRSNAPTSLAFSNSGRVLAVGGVMFGSRTGNGADGELMGQIHLWDMWSCEKIRDIDAPQGAVLSLAFSPDGRTLAAGGDDTTILLWDLAGDVRNIKSFPVQLTPAEFDSLWSDLGGNAAKADRAIWTLVGTMPPGLKPLRERLAPVTPADAKQVAMLLADLAGDQFAARQKAAKALTDLGEAAEAALRKTYDGNPPLEVRQRLAQILEKRDQDPEILRRLRAIEALELIGSPQAQRVLQTLVDAAPNPRVSNAAAAALQRLGQTLRPVSVYGNLMVPMPGGGGTVKCAWWARMNSSPRSTGTGSPGGSLRGNFASREKGPIIGTFGPVLNRPRLDPDHKPALTRLFAHLTTATAGVGDGAETG